MTVLVRGVPGQFAPPERTTFSYPERGGKTRCDVCGRTGYGETGRPIRPAGWQRGCLRGHWACRGCGRWTTALLNGSARRGHKGCPATEIELPPPSVWLP